MWCIERRCDRDGVTMVKLNQPGKHSQPGKHTQPAKLSQPRRPAEARRRNDKTVVRIIESDLIHKVSYDQYRDKVRDKYSGPQGAFLATGSFFCLHAPLGERLFRKRRFDLTGCKRILDVGSGAGQIAKHLLKYADWNAKITCLDLSHEMLRRARNRLKSHRPKHVVADVTRLPFASEAFDCITCGYVLEHLPDVREGLCELSRVLTPGGRILVFATEDTLAGAWTSRLWDCRTYNRDEFYAAAHSVGLRWRQELWFTRLHKALKAGGICVELQKPVF